MNKILKTIKSVSTDPNKFFKKFRYDWQTSFTWLIAALIITTVGGGILSVALSAAFGIPIGEMLAFLQDGNSYVIGYAIFLAVATVLAFLSFMLNVLMYHLIIKLFDGAESFSTTLGIVVFASLPRFIVQCLPEFMPKNPEGVSAAIKLIAHWWNWGINAAQLITVGWSYVIIAIGFITVHKLSKTKSIATVLLRFLIVAFIWWLFNPGSITLAM